ncbi:MAG: hypothetical protein ATN34_03245, partial [Epulopiscium sp. Nele67-Bin002]
YHNKQYKTVVIINMLSTALSPLCSTLTSIEVYPYYVGLILMIVAGTAVGFIMPTISSHVMTAHSGYSLYNMGFACGFVGIIVYAVISGVGLKPEALSIIYTDSTLLPMIIMIVYCLALIIIGYKLNNRSFEGFRDIFNYSGRVMTDFVQQVGFPLTIINMGVLGLMSILVVIVMGGQFNGPVLAAIFSVIGFSAFGKHLKNSFPIMIGVILASLLLKEPVSSTTLIMTALFSTGLAPIAGEFGTWRGISVGMLHMFLVLNLGSLHGGMMLYNNGFAAGIIAMLLVPMMEAFKREKGLD